MLRVDPVCVLQRLPLRIRLCPKLQRPFRFIKKTSNGPNMARKSGTVLLPMELVVGRQTIVRQSVLVPELQLCAYVQAFRNRAATGLMFVTSITVAQTILSGYRENLPFL